MLNKWLRKIRKADMAGVRPYEASLLSAALGCLGDETPEVQEFTMETLGSLRLSREWIDEEELESVLH